MHNKNEQNMLTFQSNGANRRHYHSDIKIKFSNFRTHQFESSWSSWWRFCGINKPNKEKLYTFFNSLSNQYKSEAFFFFLKNLYNSKLISCLIQESCHWYFFLYISFCCILEKFHFYIRDSQSFPAIRSPFKIVDLLWAYQLKNVVE